MSAKFLLDENLPFALIPFLEDRDHTVYHIKKLGKSGITNGEVYQVAEELKCWILKRDTDFQSLEKFLRSHAEGIVVFKQTDMRTRTLISTMKQLLTHVANIFSDSRLVVVNDNGMRIYHRKQK